jgi:hypothetical protein
MIHFHSTLISVPVSLYDSSTIYSTGSPVSGSAIVTNAIFLNDYQQQCHTLIALVLSNGLEVNPLIL